MIKKNPVWKIVLSFLLALVLWSFTFARTDLFGSFSTPESFKFGYYITALLCCIPIFLLGALRIELSKKVYMAVNIVSYAFAVIGSMVVAILFCGGFQETPYVFIINIAFYLFAAAVALIISGSMRVSALATLIATYIFNVICFIVYCFRGTSLSPTDIYGFRTAMNVASQYSFTLKYQIITATIVTIVLIMLVCKFPIKPEFRHKPIILRGAGAAIAAACTVFITTVDVDSFEISAFDQYYVNLGYGSAFGFYANAVKMGLKKHNTYDTAHLNEILGAYEEDATVPYDKPNVVVVMNESFSDLAAEWDFSTNIDYMPFTHMLTDNTVKGRLLVSPFGGITCNSEYEFLTGMNTGLLAPNSMPYMQMIFDEIPYSMVSHMKALGYHTLAFHPYKSTGWNRQNVYNYLGFDEFITIDNMYKYNDSPSDLRGFMSDVSDYDTILNYLRKKDPDRREFIFNVTMQNHGGYQYEGFSADVKITDMEGSYPEAEQYLSLMKRSDDALWYFVNELQTLDEPVILLVFGDHQPGIEYELFEEKYGKRLSYVTDEELTRRYYVPFFIWANYDMEHKSGINTSPCFLSGMLMEAAGLPKSRVQMYLDDVQKKVRQLNPLGWFDAEGNWHEPPEAAGLEDYYNLQYAIITNEDLNYEFDYIAASEATEEIEEQETEQEIIEQ